MWFPEMMVPQVTMDPKYENGLIQYQNGLIPVFCFVSLYFRKPSSGPQITVLPKSRCLGQMLLHLRSYFWLIRLFKEPQLGTGTWPTIDHVIVTQYLQSLWMQS